MPPAAAGPSAAEVPKEEIGAAAFVRSNPRFDGRGVIVGVFDTGVDPAAPGLQTTTEGKPKILDLVDCTGSGDVDTSATADPSADGTLKGLTGRTLTLPRSWPPIASGESYHLGTKFAFELYPRGLVTRVKQERRKAFDEAHRRALAQVQAELAAAAASPASPSPPSPSVAKRAEDERKARVALLERMEKAHDDVGPLYDVVAYLDAAGVWRACLDTSEAGDLASCALLAPYRAERRHGTLDAASLLSYSLDVLADGARVSICVDAGAHGTHVAGIIGAHFPDRAELNGVAPGCQLIGFKIGDTRLGSMETGESLVRALGAALERGCHVVNLSYGEYAHVDNYGRFTAMAEDAVHKHGLVFVTSAGNNGPALSTCGAPGTSECAIAVGAFASAAMMGPQYSLRAPLPDIQYTWSSRGPNVDGALGVNISAPGGAIAPVPNWTLQARQLMNGTSMAAPNACGGVALLLSALLARGAEWNPALLRRAIENSAAQAPNATGGGLERWSLGAGLLDVGGAHEWLRARGGGAHAHVRYAVRATLHGVGAAAASAASHLAATSAGGARGVYLREPQHACADTVVADVLVSPTLPESRPNSEKVAVDVAVALRPSAPWLSCAPHLALTHGGKSFQLKLNLSALPPGAHYAHVAGFDSEAEADGPLFTVPVTVCRPHVNLLARGGGARGGGGAADSPCCAEFDAIPFHPGHIERRFVVPPAGATWATVRLSVRAAARSDGGAEPRLFVLHTAQLLPQVAVGRSESVSRVQLPLPAASEPAAEFTKSIAVEGGVTLELCVAQWWSALGDALVCVRVEFHGLVPESARVLLDGREPFTPLRVHAPFRRTALEPEGSLGTLRRAVRPSSAKLHPPCAPSKGCPGRGDVWPGARTSYEYVLAYRFSLKDAAEAVTVRFPALNGALYDSPYEAQLHALFDGHRRVLAWGDYYGGTSKVPAGEAEVRLCVRHECAAFLERLRAMPAILEIKLKDAIKLEFAHSRAAALGEPALAAAKPPLRMGLEAGARAQLYVLAPAAPELAEPGDTLEGTFTLAKAGVEAGGSGKRPSGWAVVMLVPPAPPKKETQPPDVPPKPPAPPAPPKPPAPPAPAEDDETSEARMAQAVRDLRLAQLGRLTAKCKAEAGGAAPAGAPADAGSAAAHGPSARERYDALFAELRAELERVEAAGGASGARADAAAPGAVPDKPLLPLLAAHAAHLDALAAREDGAALRAVVHAAGDVVAQVDTLRLAAAFGVTVDADDPVRQKQRQAADEHKKMLVDALSLKALALADLHKLAAKAAAADALDELDSGVSELHRWAAPAEHTRVLMAWHRAHGRLALALTALEEQLGKEKGTPAKADVEQRVPLLRALGWGHLADSIEAQLVRNYPLGYPPVFNRP